ncbi:hypothetical protein VOLCADRAFT_88798 [Volvox carteri f. nagariensis]|uniref:Uncharacterized protein n=1 Tax=Volvox carteri f. nagariensis TaxID=3068 RepID=D8TPZ3_VOLCA|nr:uncharacterized protein VOLCADRAFT_88797 [Volvox carteri f. nagariensis]XP_002948440.1 uncharacterized protein VOLCADRAFT_88798 [Volvox carteri f. nagariensis]EFJ50314.1 hypothetical protein VOLCADRAFT_88797 [Volvox carteri f. nagariensis]EFJ50315.1 hypothetical protein VOLCADRAFT_88798 [Volvox carteri f. nagariensis]|eukprot:XP_002948439.1 hypothetical protein VOLCADRAFT_88797 [Volvox carteri f. nagariensis]
MALKIALRIDRDLDSVKLFLDRCSGFGVREVAGSNEHWHFLVETDSYRNIQSFRVALTRKIPTLKGNACYSATVVSDLEKYERYLAKGESEGAGPEVVWRHSLKYTDEKIEELHIGYWTENKRLRKRKAGSVIDAVIDIAKDENVHWERREKLAELYLKEVVSRNRPVNIFAARSAVNTIQIQLCPDDTAIKRFSEMI